MSLPLEERVSAEGVLFHLTPRDGASPSPSDLVSVAAPSSRTLLPLEALAPGEQYRFHFDMTKCIGCHCCEVACNEQNNNPSDIRWRRVGEIEGGVYPLTQRLHLSMGCNHCLQPSCLEGCPVEAYTKDPATGLVLHSADACIGCQYCTWNCPYGVPQYNPERGVVGKCDMCHGRLRQGMEPACVQACPEEAIRIEAVNVAAWLQQVEANANAPGLPPAGQTLSTTRITLPANLPAELEKGDARRVRPEHAHLSLVGMTVLTQLSVGAFACDWLAGWTFGRSVGWSALAALLVGLTALAASTLHLGRPLHAPRAIKMWRRSWLSREVLLFSLFALAASAYAGQLWFRAGGAGTLGVLCFLPGIAGVYASARIYQVPARPAWNSAHTTMEFLLTGVMLGPLLIRAMTSLASDPAPFWLLPLAVCGILGQAVNQAVKFIRLVRAEEFELRASGELLARQLAFPLLARYGLLTAAFGFSLGKGTPLSAVAALLAALASELCGRYLFFVSVVPRNIASTFLTPAREVAA